MKDAGSGRVVCWGTKRYLPFIYEILNVMLEDETPIYRVTRCLMEWVIFGGITWEAKGLEGVLDLKVVRALYSQDSP